MPVNSSTEKVWLWRTSRVLKQGGVAVFSTAPWAHEDSSLVTTPKELRGAAVRSMKRRKALGLPHLPQPHGTENISSLLASFSTERAELRVSQWVLSHLQAPLSCALVRTLGTGGQNKGSKVAMHPQNLTSRTGREGPGRGRA